VGTFSRKGGGYKLAKKMLKKKGREQERIYLGKEEVRTGIPKEREPSNSWQEIDRARQQANG